MVWGRGIYKLIWEGKPVRKVIIQIPYNQREVKHKHRCICEQFACLPNLVVFSNSLGMNGLGYILLSDLKHDAGYKE